MRTQRQLRIGEEVRHALAALLLRGDTPWPRELSSPVVTITEVKVSPDLKNATAYVMPLGGRMIKETVRAMNDAAGFYRYELARAVKLRHVPKLQFTTDESFEEAERIGKILHAPDVARDLKS